MNHRTLPAGYRVAGVMDFVRNRRQMKIVAFAALGLTAAMLAWGFIAHPVAHALRLCR